MTTITSASVSLISAAATSSIATSSSTATSSTSSSGLVQMANGEYTAASVATDPTDATKLGLVKEKDGNYGTSAPKQVAPSTSASTSVSGGTQAALSSLTLGGA